MKSAALLQEMVCTLTLLARLLSPKSVASNFELLVNLANNTILPSIIVNPKVLVLAISRRLSKLRLVLLVVSLGCSML